MLKLIIFLVAIYAIYRLFANDILKKRREEAKQAKEETDSKIEAGEMVQDPECGTYVAVDSSISVRNGDKVYYFCSYDCRDKFLKRLESGGKSLS